jgi:hypothetical protein
MVDMLFLPYTYIGDLDYRQSAVCYYSETTLIVDE